MCNFPIWLVNFMWLARSLKYGSVFTFILHIWWNNNLKQKNSLSLSICGKRQPLVGNHLRAAQYMSPFNFRNSITVHLYVLRKAINRERWITTKRPEQLSGMLWPRFTYHMWIRSDAGAGIMDRNSVDNSKESWGFKWTLVTFPCPPALVDIADR